MKGKVYLVGAGPGDPELLTVKALRLLQTADAVLYDDLVAPEILNLIASTAQLHNVGKRCGEKRIRQEQINFLMIALADSGVNVVRLKSGDPMIFGRAGEEIEALRKAGISWEVVPGISSALGAAASSGIPLTHRHISSAVVFMTAHHASGSDEIHWAKLAASGATLVLYMPGPDYGDVAAKLSRAGLAQDVPCALVSNATSRRQRVHLTTVGRLDVAPQLPAPTLLVVGEVVRKANHTSISQFAVTLPDSPSLPSILVQESPASFRTEEPIA